MHRDVERRQPVLDDALDVPGLEIREGCEVAVAEREPVVVVPDVEDVAQAVGQTVHEAEVAAVGAAADAGRLQRHAERLAQRALDLELDLLAAGLAHVQEELLLRRQELPVEEVLQLAPVDREQLGAHGEPQLLGDRLRLHPRHANHALVLPLGRQ